MYPHPTSGTKLWEANPFRIQDIDTERVGFQLTGRFVEPVYLQWDGHYLVAGCESGEMLILDFSHVPSNGNPEPSQTGNMVNR